MSFHISNLTLTFTAVCLILTFLAKSHDAFDDEPFHDEEQHHDSKQQPDQPLPKDKVLLKDVKVLTFQRNKRTTSRRTHSIPQLSCVGGTAGCKLFTPDIVHCDNVAKIEDKSSINRVNWRCRADMSERVRFNHVEVICEGYDYPEDDYILLGSCGLEFTLDYSDPHDYHDKSYYKHMDDHEKAMHQERVREKLSNVQSMGLMSSLIDSTKKLVVERTYIIGFSVLLVMFLVILVRYYYARGCRSGNSSNRKAPKKAVHGYGPLTSAVIATKKAC